MGQNILNSKRTATVLTIVKNELQRAKSLLGLKEWGQVEWGMFVYMHLHS